MTTYCTEFRCPTDDDINAIAEHAKQMASNTSTYGA
jgi:hypothetical protein